MVLENPRFSRFSAVRRRHPEGKPKSRGGSLHCWSLERDLIPEFTGRENVLLNAAIQGISREAIESRFDEIEKFAGIGEFIEHPVKTYSSGMYVRLAFAAAVGMEPEILIVDEALAVGDIRFQRKCYRHFHELQSRGTTVIFVTHAVELVRSHCDRAILLNKGKIESIGAPKDVIHDYLELMFAPDPRKGSVREDIESTEAVPAALYEEVSSTTVVSIGGHTIKTNFDGETGALRSEIFQSKHLEGKIPLPSSVANRSNFR